MDIDTAATRPWDLVVVGSGPAGAAIVHEVHRIAPEVSILVVEGGRRISANAGEHLVEADSNALREAFETLMRRARQIDYVNRAGSVLSGEDRWTPTGTGIFPASFLGHDFSQFPGASIAWNVGGMGVHWAAASPTPYGDEVPQFARPTFTEDLDTAKKLLRVTSQAFTGNPFQPRIIEALQRALPSSVPGRDAQNMPLAGVQRVGGGSFARTGPRNIAPVMFDESAPNVSILTGTLVTRVLHRGRNVTGVVVRDVVDGRENELVAGAVVVAADTLRTPQLLWASGIRPEALGLYLNEHASIDGSVTVDPKKLGMSGTEAPEPQENEPFVGAYWSPSIGDVRPTHGQMMETFASDGHRIGMSWYTKTDLQRENRIEFSDTEMDALGMPRMTARFAYSDADLERIELLRGVQRRAASALGDFTPGDSETLAPGSSLHYTGTVRLGPTDDGTSVGGPDGRVWGYDNLYVSGNGAVPTALSCNSTLAGMALSVRTAVAVAVRAAAASTSVAH